MKSRRRDRSADDYGLYVVLGDSRGNRPPGAQAPLSAFANGDGMSPIHAAAKVSAVAVGSLWLSDGRSADDRATELVAFDATRPVMSLSYATLVIVASDSCGQYSC